MFDTREPKTGPGPSPKPKTPTPTTAPRPLKANQQRWERTFRGAAKGVTFQLRIIRRPDGHLSARYQATPGKGSGWHLEGQLRDDNTFTLKGTENEAEFQGKISPDGKTIVSSFTNPTPARVFKVDDLILKYAFVPVSNASEAKPDKPEQDQDSDTSNGIPIEDVYSAIKESAKKMGKGLAINYKEHAKSIKTAIDDQNISSREQIAYIIATAVWESGGFTSLREKYDSGWSAEEYFEQSYGPNPTKLLKRDSNRINKGETAEQILKIRKKRNIEKLGNVSPGDGSKYRGRGYIHITGKRNYSEAQKNIVGPSKLLVEGNKPDIISDPELAATNRHIAALLLVKGMKMGIYTGVNLDDFIKNDEADFIGARSIVNGSDQSNIIGKGANSALSQLSNSSNTDQDQNKLIIPSDQNLNTLRSIPVGGYTNNEINKMEKGEEIGRFNDVPAYYNGPIEAKTWGSNYVSGKYYGYKWQCVEFVRRYTHITSGILISHRGNAGTFYNSGINDTGQTFDGFTQCRNRDHNQRLIGSKIKPKAGDVIVIGTATYGHVAIISNVAEDYIDIVQQNVGTKFTERLEMQHKNSRWILDRKVLCWLTK